MSVPLDVRDEVAVIDPPVIDEKIAVIPEMSEEKRLVEVAFVVINDENTGVSVKV